MTQVRHTPVSAISFPDRGAISARFHLPTIADLVAFPVDAIQDGKACVVLGYHTPGDGGGGTFRYSASSIATAEGGTVFSPVAGLGRWLRVSKGKVNVRWFGANGDNSTDDTAAIQSAINRVQTDGGGVVYFPPGDYIITAKLSVTKNRVTLRGEQVGQSISAGTTLKTTSTTDDVIQVSAAGQAISGFAVENINIIGNQAGSTGSGVHLISTVANPVSGIRFDNVSVMKCAEHGVHLDANLGFVFNGSLTNLNLTQNNGAGIRFTGAVGQITSLGVYCDGNGQHQIDLYGNAPYSIDAVGFYRCTGAGAPATYAGVRMRYVASATFIDFHAESNTTYEVLAKSCRGVRFQGGGFSQSGASQGMVIGHDGAYDNRNWHVDVPGWTNTTTNKRVDISQFRTTVDYWLYFGFHADGPFSSTDLIGFGAVASVSADAYCFAIKEFVTQAKDYAARVTGLVNATGKTILSVTLTNGNWLVWGNVVFAPSGANVTDYQAGISTADNTEPTQRKYAEFPRAAYTAGSSFPVPTQRIQVIGAQQTVYLVGFCNFTGGSVDAFGELNAQRI